MPFEKGQSGNPEKQFQPGQVTNPAGRPVGSKNRATLFKKWLETPYTFTNPATNEEEQGTIEDALVLGLILKASSGDAPAAREVLDSVYGKQDSKLVVETPKKVTIKLGGKTPAPAQDDDGGE